MLRITCVIPTSGSERILPHVRKCLSSLQFASSRVVRLTLLVVSDNPKTREYLLAFPIQNFYFVSHKTGFSRMNNVVIEESMQYYDSDYYLFVNDDASVSKDFFAQFKRIVSTGKNDIISPVIYRLDKTLDSFGVEYFTSGFATNARNTSTITTLATAACVFVKTTVLKSIKLRYGFYFNPFLYSYYEDVEFSLRALGLGAQIVKSEALTAYHAGSLSYGSESDITAYNTQHNLLWVICMTWPWRVFVYNLPDIVLIQLRLIFCSLRDFRWTVYPRILFDTIMHLYVLLQIRKKILSSYDADFDFFTVFSAFSFRTRRHGRAIRFPFYWYRKGLKFIVK